MRSSSSTFLLLLIILVASGCGPQSDAGDEGSSTSATRSRSADAAFPGGKLIDLTHPFDENTVYWPNAEGFKLVVDSAQVTDQGFFYAANHFMAAEHGGTHIDAPIHFAQGRGTVDQIPLDRLVGPAVVIDVAEKCAENPDYEIGVDDFRDWEVKHDRQLVDVIVLIRTGFSRYWPDREKYLGTAERGQAAIPKLHFPGVAPEAAQWLVEQRAVKSVGIDTASIDYGQSELFQTHVTLFKHDVPAFENVAYLDQLPEQGFSIVALPMKIAGGSGGPLRIIAIVPEGIAGE